MSTVYLVDDDASFLKSTERLLRLCGYKVLAFNSVHDFIRHRKLGGRGCLVVDLKMPELSGLELQAELAKNLDPIAVVFLSGEGDIPASVSAMKAGAEDFLTKPVSREVLCDAIDRAINRNAEHHDQVTRQQDLRARYESLTPREREILGHLFAGKLNKEIAFDLGLAERTVKFHRANIMEKLCAQTSTDMWKIAQELGLAKSS